MIWSDMTVKFDEWVLVAHIDVDAGVVWIGDPCYSLTHESEYTPKTWFEFCDDTFNDASTIAESVNAPLKKGGEYNESLGIEVRAGPVVGTYPVYVKYSDEGSWGTRVKAVMIDFLGELGDSDDE
jgi:hypothetical protein